MGETEETLNIKVFRRLSNKHFMEGLEKAPSMLKPRQASLFFKTVLSHFSKEDVPQETGDAILKSVAKCICNEENLRYFMDGSFAAMLPYKNTKFHNSIFNILYVIVTTDPTCIDETIASNMGPLIRNNPNKSLTIIAFYCQQFSQIDNPWPMVDLLIQDGKYFNTPSVAPDYISLLSFLNKKFIEYRNGRAQHCWNQVTSMILSSDKNTLKCCYGGLCAIADGYSGGLLPLDMVAVHMKQADLQDCVLALLNVAVLNEKDAANKKLISALMTVAETNVKATLVLMKLGCGFASAQTILSIPGWTNKNLPTATDTLRLFLVLLRHKDLRDFIADSPDFVEFLKKILTFEKSGMAPIACTIIRRVPLSKDLVTNLSKSGFLSMFYDANEDEDDGLTQHSKLLLTDTICRVVFVKDFITMCDKIAEIIMDDGEFADAASLVAIRLCKYSRCKNRMKELKLDAFFKKNRNEPKFQSTAKKFLRAVADSDQNQQ